MKKTTLLLPVIVILGALGLSSIYIVDEREKVLVLQFGQINAVKEEPGLGFKIPFIQEVVRYDDRILSLDTQPTEVTPSEPSTARICALRMPSSRSSAARTPPTPTACRNWTTSLIR